MEASPPLFLIVISLSGVLSQCSGDSGPSGVTECIRSSVYYNQYQWSTCLTNAYKSVKSNGKHKCIDSTATYCSYLCMLESYGKVNGSVYSACSCKPGDKYEERDLELPLECYSPSGTSCVWYFDCLKKKYPCSGTGDKYALNYATKFCNFYDKHYSGFSAKSREWIDSVRKCLQVALVPIIRPYSHLSCAEMKNVAFSSHVRCYVKPKGKDDDSAISNLEVEEFWKILLTMKSSLTMSYDSNIKSVANLFATFSKCPRFRSFDSFGYKAKIRNLKMKIKFQKKSEINLQFAYYIGNHISEQLGWDNERVKWFTYISNVSVSHLELDVYIFLADALHYDLNADVFASANLNEVVANFQNQILEGKITASESNLKFSALTLLECTKINCNRDSVLHIAPETSNRANFSNRQIFVISCFLIFRGFVDI